MYASVIIYALVALTGVMSSPAQEAEVMPRVIEPRMPTMADIPFPRFPSHNRHGKDDHKNNHGEKGKDTGCSTDTNTQANLCSAGNPYCCSGDGNGGHICANTTACTEKVICCNNNNGFQICIGEIDFNVPVTINIIYE
ncbi:hydrophobin 1 [Trichoderma austrokoningii]